MVTRSPGSSDTVEALLSRVRGVDSPYQAWAAVALMSASSSGLQEVGAQIAARLQEELPVDLEHGDLVCCALLRQVAQPGARCQEVTALLPVPHLDRVGRSRLFDSPLYIYLITRGLVRELPWGPTLAALVAHDAQDAAEDPGSDLTRLVFHLATLLELRQRSSAPSALIRQIRARIIISSGDPEEAIALRWLIERYRSWWPAGSDAAELLTTCTDYVGKHFCLRDPRALRPHVAVMLLETLAGEEHSYRFLSEADVEREVSARLGPRRAAIAVACVIAAGVLAGAPQVVGVWLWDLSPWMAVVATISLLIPIGTWIVQGLYARPRQEKLWIGLILGLGYYGAALYASVADDAQVLELLGGESSLTTIAIILLEVIIAAAVLRPTTSSV